VGASGKVIKNGPKKNPRKRGGAGRGERRTFGGNVMIRDVRSGGKITQTRRNGMLGAIGEKKTVNRKRKNSNPNGGQRRGI